MPQIVRKNQKIFGSTAGPTDIGQFGSLAAASPAYSTDPDVIQALSNYLDGWLSAVVGDNSPAIEDMNALCYLFAYQLSYLLQSGVPEWNASTTYYIGNLVRNSSGVIYRSLTDDNLNNALTDNTNWSLPGAPLRAITTSDNVLSTDKVVRATHTGGSISVTLPSVANVPVGWTVSIKNRSSDGSNLVIVGTIDGASNLTIGSTPTFDSVTLCNNGTDYDLI